MTVSLDVWSVTARPDEAVVLSNARKLTSDRMQKFDPSITLDGTKVAFVAFGGVQAARFELRLEDLSTKHQTKFPTQALTLGYRPCLSSDGSALAYQDFISGKWRAFVAPVDSLSRREVCDSCAILDFFPNSDSVLIRGDPDKLERMDLSTGKRSLVSTVKTGSIMDASLSPDGRWVSYLTSKQDGRAAIGIVSAAEAPVSAKQSIRITEDDRYLSCPEWSPSGRYLYFLSQRSDPCAIYAQKLDPWTKQPLGEAREVYVSPESRFHLNFPIGNGTIGVATDKIIFHACEMSGNIFLARPKSRWACWSRKTG